MHRNRIASTARVFDQCQSCGARLQHEIVLEGESIACPYCGSGLS
jgi:DNA-directed RNA polymerase subunit RPC12/RpoP